MKYFIGIIAFVLSAHALHGAMDPSVLPPAATICEGQYIIQLQGALDIMEANYGANTEKMEAAKVYIKLVRERGAVESRLLIMDRTSLPAPYLEGLLRAPYTNFTVCSRIDLANPVEHSSTSLTPSELLACKKRYEAQREETLRNLRTRLDSRQLKIAQTYMDLVDQSGQLQSKILLLERTFIQEPGLQGLLRAPYSNLSDCNRINVVTPARKTEQPRL